MRKRNLVGIKGFDIIKKKKKKGNSSSTAAVGFKVLEKRKKKDFSHITCFNCDKKGNFANNYSEILKNRLKN